MRDTGSEAKRELEPDRPNFMKTEHLTTALGHYEARVRATLAEAFSREDCRGAFGIEMLRFGERRVASKDY